MKTKAIFCSLRTLALLSGCAILFCVEVDAQGMGLVWSAPVAVANGAVNDNIRPQIALINDETPVVIWGATIGGRKAWLATGNGSVFNAPIQVNPSGQINAYTVEGPNVAAKGDTVYAVYTTYPTTVAQVMFRSSFDGGQTWTAPVWVDSLDTDLPTFANVGIVAGGQPVVAYMHQTATYANPRYVIRRSLDAGQTWLPEVNASDSAPGSTVCDCCTGQPYWHDGKVIVTFRNNDANLRDMWATTSADGGASFGNPIDLDSTDWQLAACPSSGPVSVFNGDSIYTAFMSQGGNGQARVYFGASSISTGQLGYNWMIHDTTGPATSQNYPTIAGNGDTIVVAWYQNVGGNPEIALRYSFAGAAGLFSQPIQYITHGTSGVQTFPDMVWALGKLHLVWQDDATGNVMYSTATVGPLAGTASPSNEWLIFPNPSNGRFKLTGMPASTYSLNVYDALGHAVFESQPQNEAILELDMTALPAGTYFVRLLSPNYEPSTKRLFFQK